MCIWEGQCHDAAPESVQSMIFGGFIISTNGTSEVAGELCVLGLFIEVFLPLMCSVFLTSWDFTVQVRSSCSRCSVYVLRVVLISLYSDITLYSRVGSFFLSYMRELVKSVIWN